MTVFEYVEKFKEINPKHIMKIESLIHEEVFAIKKLEENEKNIVYEVNNNRLFVCQNYCEYVYELMG